MNIINGGAHADNSMDFQEFMVVPSGAETFAKSPAGTEVFHQLKTILKSENLQTAVGDEGGFAPNLASNQAGIDYLMKAIDKAGYKAGTDIKIALDVAATEFYDAKQKRYVLSGENKSLTVDELINYYENLCNSYPICSIEDPLDESDWQGWQALTRRIGQKVQLVGDDLFVTNTKYLQRGIDEESANAILVKVNQIGTLTETLSTINLAQSKDFSCIISHRSGDSEDTFIADLAVATQAGQIKTAPYLVVIALLNIINYYALKSLGKEARYLGEAVFRVFQSKIFSQKINFILAFCFFVYFFINKIKNIFRYNIIHTKYEQTIYALQKQIQEKHRLNEALLNLENPEYLKFEIKKKLSYAYKNDDVFLFY